MYKHDLMGGTSTTTFSPTASLTRSQLAMILHRMAGSPSVSGLSNKFTDISSSAEYYKAVLWVYNNGNNIIMGGTTETKFDPDGYVSREMMAVVIDRYAARLGKTLSKLRTYSAFKDDGQISDWASDSVKKMYEAYIISGEENYFYPTKNIKRGDAAIIIRKYCVI